MRAIGTLGRGGLAPGPCRRGHRAVVVERSRCPRPRPSLVQERTRRDPAGNEECAVETREARGSIAAGAAIAAAPAERAIPVPNVSLRRIGRAALAFALAVLAVALCLALSPSRAHAVEEATRQSRTLFEQCVSLVLHLDKHLMAIISQFGEEKTYALLAAIVFCETGLVVTPFLPGDSLLFACGAFAALGSLKLQVVTLVLCMSAIAGDAVNYGVGQWVGRRILRMGIISQKNITKTEAFYEKHGPKTIVLARFVPIVRTFAPFVAGIGSMEWTEFTLYNVLGAVIWTASLTCLGFFFGNLPLVQHNFTLVVLGIVAVSVLPIVYEVLQSKRG